MGRRIMARVASGVVFNQVHFTLLPLPASIFPAHSLMSNICLHVALSLSHDTQSIRLLGTGEGGSGLTTVMVWGRTRDWG